MDKFKKEFDEVVKKFAANGEKIGLIMLNDKSKNDTVIGGIKIVYNKFVPDGKMLIIGDQAHKRITATKTDWPITNPFGILK